MKTTFRKKIIQSPRQKISLCLTERAFTLIELLVIVTTVGLLCVTLLPVVSGTKPNTQSFVCLNNNRRLCAAWRLYTDDNRDRLVFASDDGTANPLNQYAWTQGHLDFNPANRDNWDPAVGIWKSPLWRYSGNDENIYRCPSDSTVLAVNGILKPRVRSMAMNFYLGGFAGSTGGIAFANPFCLYTKLTEIGGSLPTPSPAKLWVFQDIRPESLNWGSFVTDMTGYAPSNAAAYKFADLPGLYHNGAAAFSFADSHCEMRKWRDRRTTPAITFNGQVTEAFASPGNVDIAWLQDHSTRPK